MNVFQYLALTPLCLTQISWTKDWSEPTRENGTIIPSGGFMTSGYHEEFMLKAMAFKDGMADSAVMEGYYYWDTGEGPTAGGRIVTYAYTPDKLNRGSVTDNGITTNYSHSALNQYTNTSGNSYSYDSNFNLTHATGFNGVYDAANRLVSASGGGSGETAQLIVGFVYDGLGRCVKRTFNGVATVIIYDGWKPVAEFDGWGYLQAWNLYGPGADEILLRQKDGIGYTRFLLDRHGNPVFLLNENGVVLEKYKYDAFGKPTVTDANGTNARSWSYYEHCFLFQGREYIRELGIYDYRNRFYLPALGRFLQSDPIGFNAGDMNLFRYVGDGPIDRSDPTGLQEPGPIPDRMWEMARFADRSNNSHDERNPSQAGMEESTNSGSKSASAENEGKKVAPSRAMVQGAVQAYKSLLKWVRKIESAGRMTAEFVQGKGPTERVFGPNSPESNDLRSDPEYASALKKASASGELENADFGGRGAVSAGLHPTRQFVGSYKVGVNDGTAFIHNQTSAWSLFYHARFLSPQGHERPGAFGNTNQIYIMGPAQ